MLSSLEDSLHIVSHISVFVNMFFAFFRDFFDRPFGSAALVRQLCYYNKPRTLCQHLFPNFFLFFSFPCFIGLHPAFFFVILCMSPLLIIYIGADAIFIEKGACLSCPFVYRLPYRPWKYYSPKTFCHAHGTGRRTGYSSAENCDSKFDAHQTGKPKCNCCAY